MNDWEILIETEPWLFSEDMAVVIEERRPPGSWIPRSHDFAGLFPTLTSLLSRARITDVRIQGRLHHLFAWGTQPDSIRGWLCSVPVDRPPPALFAHHQILLQSFGGITERLNEPSDTWLLNMTDVLTATEAERDATFIADYSWAFEDAGVEIPIELDDYYSIAREANGNNTICHRSAGDLVMFAPDHSFDHLVVLEDCPEYSLYRINGAATFSEWISVVAGQWSAHISAA